MSLEGEIRQPEEPPVGSAVICHAHPRHGGSKDHPILWALRNDLASRGFVVLAFNFRGTMQRRHLGGSRGDQGRRCGHRPGTRGRSGAHPRVRVVVRGQRRAPRGPERRSGGCARPHRAAARAGRRRDSPDARTLRARAFTRPTLLLAGEGDVYCPRPRLESLARTMPNAELVIVPGTDHFLWHREKAVAETVGSFAVRTLVSADGQQG